MIGDFKHFHFKRNLYINGKEPCYNLRRLNMKEEKSMHQIHNQEKNI